MNQPRPATVDLIDQVPSNDLPRLRSDPRIAVHEIAGSQLIHLTFNLSNPDALPYATDHAAARCRAIR